MSTDRDYYEILGVSKTADADTIKKAYRKLAMQFHPDKNPGDSAAEDKFKEAAEAYDILSNQEKRSQYDRFGKAAFKQGGGFGGGAGFQDMDDIFSNFGDIFSDLFGGTNGGGAGGARSQQRGRGAGSGPRRGSDLRYVTEITLKNVIEGVEKEIEFDTEDNCQACSGSGAEKGHAITCPTCHGRGQVVHQQGFFTMASTCPDCRGEGQKIQHPCKKCQGKGRVKQHRKIKITIPPGVDDGTRLRVSGEGEGGYKGGPAGDLFVETSIKQDSHFRRQGEHLITEVTLDYVQALLGAELEIPTVTGKTRLEVPVGTQVGDAIKISGEGIPSLRGSRRGDLFVTVSVEFPKKISQKEKDLLKEIAGIRGIELELTTEEKTEPDSRLHMDDKSQKEKTGFWKKK
jgi:molecular chaperone DnaJ